MTKKINGRDLAPSGETSCPYILRFKLLMKKVFEDPEIATWMDEVKGAAKDAWLELLKETVLSESLVFPRTTRPAQAIGAPTVIGFDDGSFEAFSAVVYTRWEVPCQHQPASECTGDFHCQLLCAKAKVTPLAGVTVPRSEMSGLTLSSRLVLSTVKAMATEDTLRPAGDILLLDSECSISALAKTS